MATREGWDPGLAEGIDEFIAERTDDLLELLRRLVGFNTVSVDLSPGSDHRENQEGERMPPWHHWEGRPITVATLRGPAAGAR